uniref:Ovule protein n=1 Tax=Panagrolaimus sp. JU765 TaxID=591449 RepID=A0AC34QKJ5_9BILA
MLHKKLPLRLTCLKKTLCLFVYHLLPFLSIKHKIQRAMSNIFFTDISFLLSLIYATWVFCRNRKINAIYLSTFSF